jgi:hypothetical protein
VAASGPFIDNFLPPDFEARLARAWAWTMWPHLMSGSKMKAFSADDPIRLLAHNLDFWVPTVTATIQDRLRGFPRDRQGQDFRPGRHRSYRIEDDFSSHWWYAP